MKCSYYCNGYCFWNGDTGEVCDKIMFGTHKRIKDGYCSREESDRELEEHAEAIIAQAEVAEALNCKHSDESGRCLLSDSGEYCVLGPCLEYEERKNDLQNH